MNGRWLTTACILLMILLLSCGCDRPKIDFTPCELTYTSFDEAARKAMFTYQSIEMVMPVARRPGVKFDTRPWDDSLLVALRERYDLDAVIEGAEDEWQAQLMLRHWLHEKIQNGTPEVEAGNAIEILDAAAKGHKFWCSYYAISYVQCALALGWQARKISLDHYHEPGGVGSRHHGAAEVWSNMWRKWIYIDPQSDLHFVRNGLPLTALEVRANYLGGTSDEVSHVVGVPPDTVCRNPAIVWWDLEDEDETALFFWLIYHDSYATWDSTSPSPFYTPLDSIAAGKTWYQGGGKSIRPHTGHELGLFQPVEDMRKIYYTVGVPELRINGLERGRMILGLDVYLPDFSRFEVSWDGGDWETVENKRALAWDIHMGLNGISIRAVNKAGVSGPRTTLVLH